MAKDWRSRTLKEKEVQRFYAKVDALRRGIPRDPRPLNWFHAEWLRAQRRRESEE